MGKISAYCVQLLAEAAEIDGLNHPEIHELAALGCNGLYSGNFRRDLIRVHVRQTLAPKPMVLQVPLKNKDGIAVVHEQKFLSPLDVMQSAYDTSPALVPKIFQGELETCWRCEH